MERIGLLLLLYKYIYFSIRSKNMEKFKEWHSVHDMAS